jgi:hypothetical protein
MNVLKLNHTLCYTLYMKLDRTKLSVVDFRDSQDKEYWMKLSPEGRLQALQINRQAAYGKPNASGRLQRVLEIAERT